MTRQDIENKLHSIIENDEIVISKTTKTKVVIPIDGFLNRFGDVELTYSALITKTVENDGWKQVFENWRQSGYIK